MLKPYVSVLMITYNHKNFVYKAIESVLNQKSSFPFELIIGDDASTDGTSKIIQSYAQRYPNIIIPIIRDTNIGASANYYDLLKRAKGKYIANLEGDDFWLDSNKLQKQVAYLENNNDYIACVHSCNIVNENGIVISIYEPKWILHKKIYTLKDFKGVKLPGHPNTMVFRNIFEKPQYDYSIIQTAHPMIADRTLTAILAAQGKIFRMSDCMSSYRVSTTSTSNNATTLLFTNNKDNWRINIDLSLKIEQYLREHLHINISFLIYRIKIYIKHYLKIILHLN